MTEIPNEIRIWVHLNTIQKQSIMTPPNLLHAYKILSRWIGILVAKKIYI
jgi:hypothetical protein